VPNCVSAVATVGGCCFVLCSDMPWSDWSLRDPFHHSQVPCRKSKRDTIQQSKQPATVLSTEPQPDSLQACQGCKAESKKMLTPCNLPAGQCECIMQCELFLLSPSTCFIAHGCLHAARCPQQQARTESLPCSRTPSLTLSLSPSLSIPSHPLLCTLDRTQLNGPQQKHPSSAPPPPPCTGPFPQPTLPLAPFRMTSLSTDSNMPCRCAHSTSTVQYSTVQLDSVQV
jgi:hypothetical protein